MIDKKVNKAKKMNKPANCSEKILINRYQNVEELKSIIRKSIRDHRGFNNTICQISEEGSFISINFK